MKEPVRNQHGSSFPVARTRLAANTKSLLIAPKTAGLQPVSFSGIYRNTFLMSFTSALFRTAVLAALGTLALASQPVTVMMPDGSQIQGTLAGASADEIKVVVAGQTLTLKAANIEAVKFDAGPAANPTQAFTPINPVPATPAAPQAGMTIPANTPVVVRLIDSADSSHDSLGKEYRASLDEPLLNQTGEVVAPRGSDVLIVLTNRQESGHFAKKTELRLALRSLTIQGKRYDSPRRMLWKRAPPEPRARAKRLAVWPRLALSLVRSPVAERAPRLEPVPAPHWARSDRCSRPVSECGCRRRRGSPSDSSSRSC